MEICATSWHGSGSEVGVLLADLIPFLVASAGVSSPWAWMFEASDAHYVKGMQLLCSRSINFEQPLRRSYRTSCASAELFRLLRRSTSEASAQKPVKPYCNSDAEYAVNVSFLKGCLADSSFFLTRWSFNFNLGF